MNYLRLNNQRLSFPSGISFAAAATSKYTMPKNTIATKGRISIAVTNFTGAL